LTDKFNADIVVSSCWRRDKKIKSILKKAGVTAQVIGITPTLHLTGNRGEEINAWIKDNNYIGDYLIIDDDIFDITPFVPMEKIIYTKDGLPENGLTMEHIYNIINPPTFKGEWLEEEEI